MIPISLIPIGKSAEYSNYGKNRADLSCFNISPYRYPNRGLNQTFGLKYAILYIGILGNEISYLLELALVKK